MCVLAFAGVVAGFAVTGNETSPTPKAAAPSSTTATPAPSPSTSSTPPPEPEIPHEVVPASWPTRFTYAGRGYTIKANVCAMPNIRPYDPPGEQHHTVCYPEAGFGSKPGSSSQTTYIFGHAWGQDNLEVLNDISERATAEILAGKPTKVTGVPIWPVKSLNGSKIIMRTGAGTLTYEVRNAYGVHKDQAGFVKPLMNEKIRNRVVILTCAERHHVDYEYNVIVEAYLVSSVRAKV